MHPPPAYKDDCTTQRTACKTHSKGSTAHHTGGAIFCATHRTGASTHLSKGGATSRTFDEGKPKKV
jgi:hypothetical protein